MSFIIFEVSFALVLGACAGSFAHAAAWRAARGLDWVRARSACYACRRHLAWYENLPLLSYVYSGGQCRCRQQGLPIRYIVAEISVSAIFVANVLVHGTVMSLVFAPYLIILAIIFFTDLEAYYIPNWASLGGSGLGLALAAFEIEYLPTLSMAICGAVAGFALLWVINHLYKLWRHRDGFGGGDAKLMMLIGAWMGVDTLLPILFIASIAGAFCGIGLILWRRAGMQTALPFGCFLVVAAIFWYFCAEFILP